MNEHESSGWERLIRSKERELACHVADERIIEMTYYYIIFSDDTVKRYNSIFDLNKDSFKYAAHEMKACGTYIELMRQGYARQLRKFSY